MKKEWKEKWIDALESGKYKKCLWDLRRVVGEECLHCATGVLGDLLVKANLASWEDGQLFLWKGKTFSKKSTLPYAALGWLGLDAWDQRYIQGLNDRGSGFYEIADWIKKNVEVTT